MAKKATSIHDTHQRLGAIRWLVRETLANLILIAMLFGAAGRWDWWMGWVLSGIYFFWTVSTAIFILPVNAAMLAERSPPHTDARKWDMALIAAMGVFMVAEYIVAGLDVHFGWSPQFPLALQFVGLFAAVLGYDILLVWAMVSNAFFVATVRNQTERKHTVVSGGPYCYVRHPGYLGMILLHWGVPFMLSSLWALIPALLYCLTLVVRTALEDETLLAELPGYVEYAQHVPHRLVPGVW